MKITNEGVVHTIQPNPFNMLWVFSDHTVTPYILNLTLEVQTPLNVKPTVNSTDVYEWLHLLLADKILCAAENNNQETLDFATKITGKEQTIIFVEKLDTTYILSTLFSIISRLMDKNCTLLSLKIN